MEPENTEVTSEEQKEDTGDVVDSGSPDVVQVATKAEDDVISSTDDVSKPNDDVETGAMEKQPEVTETVVEREATPTEAEADVKEETKNEEATLNEETTSGAGESRETSPETENEPREVTADTENESGEASAEPEDGAREVTAEAEKEASDVVPETENGAKEITARGGSGAGGTTARAESGEGNITDAGETTAEEPEVDQAPLVVRVDRRRLTTTPADSTHPPGGPSIPGPRLPALRGHAHGQGQGHIKPLPSPPEADARGRKGNERLPPRPRLPPKLIRLATVTVSPSNNRSKVAPQGPSLYYEAPSKPTKVITWDSAMAARPPLPVDLEGPTPWTYSPRNKPLYETNAPAFSFGRLCHPEKSGGSRTAWSKSWFQSPHVWLNKTDFGNDDIWPSPAHYRKRGLLGPRQLTVHEAPSFSIGRRKTFAMAKRGSDKEPAPPDYDRQTADSAIFRRGASFSHQFRRQGTVLWGSMETTPGPAAYTPLTKWRRPAASGFTIQGRRGPKSNCLGPFATL